MALICNAALYGNLKGVRTLLNSGANVNARNQHGFAALHWAAMNGHLAMVRLLLDGGANINARDGDGWTTLIYAARLGHLAMVRLLLDRGANTNGVMNRINISANMKNVIRKHAGRTILKYKKTSNMRRRAASAKTLNSVRTPNGRPLPPNAIRSIMSMLNPRSPK
jgi:ankyrin repeat protein